ncbi:MAG: hypothetical protein LBM12_00465 [Candidatus Nomurabacteria bacterium]|jgi:hypothetical protein|nr:hypothetical protein [Candidatus Nomurabacteria bacterium]
MDSYQRAIAYLDQLQLNSADYKIIGFILLWMACNQNFKDRDENCEQDKFQGYFKEKASTFLNEHAECAKASFVGLTRGSQPRNDVINQRSGKKVKLLEQNGNLTAASLAKVLYTIRCNLFHGEKDLLYNNEDRDLVGWGYDVLLGVFVPELAREDSDVSTRN